VSSAPKLWLSAVAKFPFQVIKDKKYTKIWVPNHVQIRKTL
jgi:hypothetical protein